MTPVMRAPKRSRRARLVAAASATVIVWSLAAVAAEAQTLPTGGVVVTSTDGVGVGASFTPGANSLTIDQSADRVVIDWATFNIGSTETVTFNQPTENAIAFNRVDPSAFTTIDGALVSNGGVWLFSPGGLLFGAGATVNVGSFVGSTATLSNADIADALTTNAVTLTPGAALGTLTVANGADINAATGFAVLLGETIVQNGQVVSNLDAVWYGVAQGGEIAFTPGVSAGEGPDLTDATVAAVAGQQPAFTQGSTGVTTAGTWVGVSNPSTVANGWATLINLGGTIEASGIKPSTDAGVYIITGDDGVYDLTAVDTTIDSTGGLITANNGDVFIRTGVATLQDVYAEDIDVFTGGDLTLTGAIQASSDIVIGSDTLVSIASTADVDADIDVIVTTTAAGADIDIAGDVYAYQYVTLVADDQITIDGRVEGVYGVSLFGIDVTTGAGSLITSLNDVYIQATGDVSLSGDIYAYDVTIIADGDVTQSAGTITVDDGGLYIYALNDIVTEAGALIETTIDGGGAIIYLNAGHDLYLGGDIHGGFFVTINSVGIGNDTVLEVSGSIYSTDFIILYNDYGDIHLTGTAELHAGQPTVFAEPGIWIAAEGSILTDAGSYIHTYPGYADGYVHIEVNDVTGSIDLSGDITSENITIEAPFGVVDIYLRGGTIQTANDLYIDSNGVLLVGATLYADYVTLEAVGDLTVSGAILANDGVSLTSTGGDVYIDGFVEGFAASGTAILVSAEGDLTIAASGDLEGYGDVVLQTTGPDGVLEVSGDVLGYNVYLSAQGGILVGSTADIYAYETLQLLSDDGAGGATVADIQINGWMDGNGVSIINRNDGDVILGATALVASYYYYCGSCRADPGGETGLLGQDGDIYIYSTGAVVTAAGSVIDATQGFGADAGLVTIVANGADGATAAIDLSGDIVSDYTDLQASAGSIRQRDGTITFTDGFNAYAYVDFIQDGNGVIDGLDGGIHADVDIVANGNILLGGLIEGYYVDITTHGTAPSGAEIDIAGTVIASDELTIINEDGNIVLQSTAELYAGIPFEASNPYIYLYAQNGSVTSEAGSYIHTATGYDYGAVVIRASTATPGGLGIDLAGDIDSGIIDMDTGNDSGIRVSAGTMTASNYISLNSQGVLITGDDSEIYAPEVYLESDDDMTLGGDIEADYVHAMIYSAGAVDGAEIRVDGLIEATDYIYISNQVGGFVLGAGGELYGNTADTINQLNPAIEVRAETIASEAGSMIRTPANGEVYLVGTNASGLVVDLDGDADVGIFYARTAYGDGDIVIGGDLTAADDIQINSNGALTTLAGSTLDAGDLVRLRSDRDMLLSGDVIAGNYFVASIYGGESGGVDESWIRVEGDVDAGNTIRIYNDVGDVEIGAGAQLHANLDGLAFQSYQTYDVDIFGENILTEAGSLITTGANAGPRVGSILIESDDYTNAATLVDLSGDIDTDLLQLDIDNGSLRVRDGDIDTIAGLVIVVDGYFIVDEPADIYSQDDFFGLSYGGMTINGDITANDILLQDFSANDLVIGGTLASNERITIRGQDDLRIDGGVLISDADNAGATTGIYLEADGQITSTADSIMRVGPAGAPTGDVFIEANGYDGGGFSSIDLSGDIDAQYLVLEANESIRLRDGDIFVTEDLDIASVADFVMDAPATITGLEDVAISAQNNLVAAGDITADGDISLHIYTYVGPSYFTAGPGDMVVSGNVTANGSVTLITGEGGGDIYLDPTANVLANADDAGIGDDVYISAYGQVISASGSSIRVGTTPTPSGEVTILAGGTDNASYSAIDLSGDIDALTLVLQASNGSIHLADGTIDVINDLTINSNFDIVMDSGAEIFGDGNVDFIADRDLVMDGLIDAQGGVSLLVTSGGQDLAVGGTILADQDVDIFNQAGDILIEDALIVADADGQGGDGQMIFDAQGSILADGGSLVVGIEGNGATGPISLSAGGDLQLDLDTYSTSLDLFAQGSIDLVQGTFEASYGVDATAYGDFSSAVGADIEAGGDVNVAAGGSIDVAGDITTEGGIDIVIYGFGNQLTAFTAGPGDIVVSGDLTANGTIYIGTGGYGDDVYLAGTAAIVADADNTGGDEVYIQANGQLISAGGSTIRVGSSGAPTGDVTLTSFGADDANYSAIDLASDIEAVNLSIDADGGSVNLAGGTIDITGDLEVESVQDIIQDEPANIYAGGDVYFDAERVLTVEGSIQAGGDVYLLVDGPNADLLTVDRLVSAGGDATIVNTGGDIVLGSETALFAGEDVLLHAQAGDISTDGFIDAAATFTADAAGSMTIQSDIQAGQGATFISGGAMMLDASIIAEGASSILATAGQTLAQYGFLTAGGDISLASYGDMNITGQVTAVDDVSFNVYGGEGGGDIVISGDVFAHDNLTIYNTADYGDVIVTSTGSLRADVDGDGAQNVELLIYADNRFIAEEGSIVHVGAAGLRTGYVSIYAYGYDGEGGAAVQIAGDVSAEYVTIEAANGSVHIQDAAIVAADESVQIYAWENFILDEGGSIFGALERTFQNDISTQTTLPGLAPGVLIAASDVDISGVIQSGDVDDDASIVIAALNVDGDVTVGGADNGLGTGFTLSDAEFDNLIANRIVLIAGTGGDAPDLHVADLSIDAANTADVWLGTSGTVFVEGDVTPSQPGAVDLHIGFTVLTESNIVDGFTSLLLGETLVDFIPGDIYISGNIGDLTNPFGHVTLVAHGDILMGSAAFIDAAETDPEFDAFDQSEDFDAPSEGHVFIAADILQMAATGAIQQQDTVSGPEFGGLVLGAPQAGYELIFSPDDIEGEPIGFGTDQWTANFNAGPTRIELFGQFNGAPHAVTGPDAALVDHLLDPDILLGDYEINTCLFGSASDCRQGGDLPPFQNPTPPVHPDPTEIPGVEEAVNFFTTFPFQEPDQEEDEERIEGEPVTGSGNEDLWPVTSQGGTRP